MKRAEAIKRAAMAFRREHAPGEARDSFEHSAISLVDALDVLGMLKFDPPPLDNLGRAEIDGSLLSMIRADLLLSRTDSAAAAALKEDLAKAGLAIVKVC